MKSLLESITMVNESGFDGIVDNIKALLCYDRLSNIKKDEVEWTEAVVDWECARFTKPDKPLNAYDTYLKYYYTSEYTGVIINTLISLGLLSVKTTDVGVVYKVTDKMDDFK